MFHLCDSVTDLLHLVCAVYKEKFFKKLYEYPAKDTAVETYPFKVISEWHVAEVMLFLDAEFNGADRCGDTGW